MTKSFFALVLAATVAVTGFTVAPARAGNGDFAKALFGVAAIAVIASAIDKNRKKSKPTPEPRYSRPEYEVHRGEGHHRTAHSRKSFRQLPARCFGQYQTRHGALRGFGASCLHNSMRHADRLPQACVQKVRTRHGRDTIYGASCMRDYGYRIERGRR